MRLDHQIEIYCFGIIWLTVGMIYPVYQIVKNEELTLGDVILGYFSALLGPLMFTAIFAEFLYSKTQRIVLWKKKI